MAYAIPNDIEEYVLNYGFNKVDCNRFEAISGQFQYALYVSENGKYGGSYVDLTDKVKFSKTDIFKGYAVKELSELVFLLNNSIYFANFQKAL